IDFSATWCGPCWNYHNTHILNDLYNQYGPTGTGDVMVFFIEADPSTPVSALYGGPGSQGNWVAGTDFPIMDDSNGAVNGAFQVSYFPTLYAVCPNRKVYEPGQVSLNGWVNWINSCSLDATSSIADVECFGEASGSIDLTVSGGLGNISYNWSNGANTPDVSNLSSGMYFCTMTEGQGHTVEIGPLQVSSPTLISPSTLQQTSPACFGDGSGSASLSASGGVPPYSYAWSNGSFGPAQAGLSGGAYLVTVTDANDCEVLHNVVIDEPQAILSNSQTTPDQCDQDNGTMLVMTTGGSFPYFYDIGNGSTPNPFFGNLSAGTYSVSVTDAMGCQEIVDIDVPEQAAPQANIAPASTLNCSFTQVVLDGSSSTQGSSIDYTWTTSDGSIVGAANTQNIIVDAAGTYELQVTDLSSGCQSFSQVDVQADFALPTANAGPGFVLDCVTTLGVLDGSSSSQGPNFSYAWTTPNGNIIGPGNVLNPQIDSPGTYELTVTNT
ncbi:MAG: hypothetical protein AAFU60_12250, partial [Bacteroidota bacterium]